MSDLHVRDIPEDLQERMKLAAAIHKVTIKEFITTALAAAADSAINAFRATGKIMSDPAASDAKTEVIPTTRRKQR